jgi:O-antigen ligase
MIFLTHRLSAWDYLRTGIIFLTFMPVLGVINLFIAVIKIWQTHYSQIVENPINRILGIFSLCLIINSCFAYHPSKAFIGLFNFLPFLGFFAAINAFITTPIQLYQLAEVIVIGSIPIHLLGLGQKLFEWEFQINLFIANFSSHNYPDSRVSSLFGNSNIFGFYAIFTLGMSLIIWDTIYRQLISNKSFLQNFLDSPQNKLLLLNFFLITATLVLNLINVITSQSRVVLVASLLILIGYFIYKKWILITGFASGFSASILLAGYTNSLLGQISRQIIPSVFWQRLQQPYPKDFPIEVSRPNIWKLAADLTWERPFTGWGLRNFSVLFQERINYWIGHPHNLFLMLSSEVGIPLALFFVGVIILIVWQGISTIKSNVLNRDVFAHQNYILPNANTVYYLYLLCSGGWIILNMVDVTLFNVTLNVFAWLIFGAINGVATHYRKDNYPPFIARMLIHVSPKVFLK